MDDITLWKNAGNLGNKYDIDEIKEDVDGLHILLTDINTGRRILLFYDCLVCSYKNTDESFWMDSLYRLAKKYDMDFITGHTFFQVLDSSYAKEVETGGQGVVQADRLFHLKIIGANAILDIVSWGMPEIRSV